jgi:hypothetical protein
VGVAILTFFNLRFGWTFSGLVVPGYLVPLLIIKPVSVGVIVVEAVFVYLLTWFVSEYLAERGLWSNFFGRDRFFAIVLMSLVVRILFDGLILPWFGEFLTSNLGLQFDYRNNLHSFGLLVVALLANQFWKPGLKRGFAQFAVVLGITFLIVRYVLMEFTNFNVEKIALMYEGIAISLLASPKAYIIIITSSFIASHLNLRYGFEYSGIMIPSLLALLWYAPLRILATIVETAVIYLGAVQILKLPTLQNTTIEGSRKLLLFFTISFAYKFILGHIILLIAPQVRIIDFYGFGYLISTLIAVKMHDKSIAAKMSSTILATSLGAIIFASLFGFVLTFFPSINLWTQITPSQMPIPIQQLSDRSLKSVLEENKVMFYKKKVPDSVKMPLPKELNAFSHGIEAIKNYLETSEEDYLENANILLNQANFRIRLIQDRYLYLQEKVPARGWGTYVSDMTKNDGLLIEVPAPIDERNVMEAGLAIFQSFDARAFVIAGAGRRTNWDGSSDVLGNPNTMFNIFHKKINRHDVLQVRGYTAETIRLITGKRADSDKIKSTDLSSSLWVKSTLPENLNLKKLERLLDDFSIQWQAPPFENVQRSSIWNGFSELLLTHEDRRRIINYSFLDLAQTQDFEIQESFQRIDGYLQEKLINTKGEIAGRGTNLYQPPSIEELLFFDEEILTPLMNLVSEKYRDGKFTPDAQREMHTINNTALAMGYEIIWYRHTATKQDYILLWENTPLSERTYRGTYVFRLGSASPFIVEVPRPLYEKNSFEFGISLFEQLNAKALLIAGAHPYANTDGSADLIRSRNKENLFNLVNQVVLRETGDLPLMVVQTRAFGIKPGRQLNADVLLSTNYGITNMERLSPLGKRMLKNLNAQDLAVKLVDGSPETAGYEIGSNLQSLYLSNTQNKEFALLWVSPSKRESYEQQTENRQQEAQFATLGIETVSGAALQMDLFDYLKSQRLASGVESMPEPLMEKIQEFTETEDVVILYSIIQNWDQFTFRRFIDPNTKQSFLLIYTDKTTYPLIVNLASHNDQRKITTPDFNREIMEDYINSRSKWFVVRE